MTEYENTSEQYEVWQNKVDPSIVWIIEPGYIGAIDDNVLDSRWDTKAEAHLRAGALWWQHTTEDWRERAGYDREKRDRLNSLNNDQQVNWIMREASNLFENTEADFNAWETEKEWATDEYNNWIDQLDYLPIWFATQDKLLLISRLIVFAHTGLGTESGE